MCRRSLNDEAIFGPRMNYRCACGKFDANAQANCPSDSTERLMVEFAKQSGIKSIICDVCGVKYASNQIRRCRFGHIELGGTIKHPLGSDTELLETFPVLPAVYWESRSGISLANLYEEIVFLSNMRALSEVIIPIQHVCDSITQILDIACSWNLTDIPVLARGLALEDIPTSDCPC
jgi:hypothetical protein